jgi:hypothetical protein
VSDNIVHTFEPTPPSGVENKAPTTGGSLGTFLPPKADLAAVKKAATKWCERLQENRENMAIFYFCGHGIVHGGESALLLQDFGKPDHEYEGAIDVNSLLGTMKNSRAVEQMFLFDCCRTAADDIYQNETRIGSRIANVQALGRGHNDPARQFVLYPTLDGEEAFGIRQDLTVFTSSLIDAFSFAAADGSTERWVTNTASILKEVDRLTSWRASPAVATRSRPQSTSAVSFDVNEIDEPTQTRSFVNLSDYAYWGQVRIHCSDLSAGRERDVVDSATVAGDKCARFELPPGRWRFGGTLPRMLATIQESEKTLVTPVNYITLKVLPR